MTELLPLVLIFAAWIPLAAAIAWFFERKPRMQTRGVHKTRKLNA